MISISVVVVAYKSSKSIKACVDSLRVDPCVTNIVVVDNSRDAETEAVVVELSAVDRRVRYLRPVANLGFGKACNLGAAAFLDSEWLAFVNPDVVLERPLAEMTARAGDSTIVSAFLAGSHPGIVNYREKTTLLREMQKALIGSRAYAIEGKSDAGTCITVDQVDGALILIRRDDFVKIGRFDERFELYYEDVDLCDRARALGSIRFLQQRWGTHTGGESFAAASAAAFVALRVSRTRYLSKRYGRGGALFSVLIALLETIARTISARPEGTTVRVRAFKAQLAEVRWPMRITTLPA